MLPRIRCHVWKEEIIDEAVLKWLAVGLTKTYRKLKNCREFFPNTVKPNFSASRNTPQSAELVLLFSYANSPLVNHIDVYRLMTRYKLTLILMPALLNAQQLKSISSRL